MANNRMWLKCTKCEPGIDENGNQKDRILIAKYYPSTNWYFFLGSVRPTKIGKDLGSVLLNVEANSQDLKDRENQFNEFFDKHKHGEDNNYNYNDGGDNFILEFDL